MTTARPARPGWLRVALCLVVLVPGLASAAGITDTRTSSGPAIRPAASADGLWTGIEPAPQGRSRHVGVYDSSLDRLVIFGGRCFDACCSDGPVPADAWSYPLAGGNTSWFEIRPDGALPPTNLGPVGIYDPVRGQLLVMQMSTVWALGPPNAPQWSTLSPTGTPPTLSLVTAVYDPAGDRMLGFSTSGRVWSLTLAGTPNWTELSPTGNVPGFVSSAIYDPSRERVVVFADSVRALDLSGPLAWSAVAKNQTTPGYSVIYDPVRDRAVVHGGSLGGEIGTGNTYELTFSGTPTWTLISASGPTLAYHSAIYDPTNDRMLIFGGYSLQFYVDFTYRELWAMSLDGSPGWTDLTPQSPPRACVNPAVRDPLRDRMLVFDGGVQALDLSGPNDWTTVAAGGPAPSDRTDYAAIDDPVRDRLVVFGGKSSGSNLQDLWTLSLSGSPQWSQPGASGTPPDTAKPAIYDPVRDRMLVVGGDHVWALSLAAPMAWSELSTSGTAPNGVYASSVIYDALRDRVVVFGGVASAGLQNDVWTLDLATDAWSLLAPSGAPPAARKGAMAVYDAARDRLVMSGGDTGISAPAADTWQLAFAPSPAWVQLAPDVEDQGGWTAIYDPDLDRMVTVGLCETGDPGCEDPLPRAWSLWFNPLVGVPEPPASRGLALAQSRPNPARGDLAIHFSVDRPGDVRLRVYDVSGRRVRTLVSGPVTAGDHTVRWNRTRDDGSRVDPGVYFYELRRADERITRRMILIR